VETTTELAFVTMARDDSILTLVVASLLIALTLFVPAVIQAAWLAIRNHRGSDAVQTQPAQRSAGDAYRGPVRQPSETDVLDCEWPSRIDTHRKHNGRSLEEENLWPGLEHPLPENRMLAVELLGDVGSSLTVRVFREHLAAETEDRVVREIALAAARIGGQEAMDLILGLKSHRSAMVREAAAAAYPETIKTRAESQNSNEMTSKDDLGAD
jgi:hypothetical protein